MNHQEFNSINQKNWQVKKFDQRLSKMIGQHFELSSIIADLLAIREIDLDQVTEADLYNLFRAKYASPKGFHRDCKERLKSFQKRNNLAESWSDNCLTPILVMDYINWGGRCALPQVHGMTTYAGI
jgi:hypothetical protein